MKARLRHWKTEIVATSVEMLSGRKKKDYAEDAGLCEAGGRRTRRGRLAIHQPDLPHRRPGFFTSKRRSLEVPLVIHHLAATVRGDVATVTRLVLALAIGFLTYRLVLAVFAPPPEQRLVAPYTGPQPLGLTVPVEFDPLTGYPNSPATIYLSPIEGWANAYMHWLRSGAVGFAAFVVAVLAMRWSSRRQRAARRSGLAQRHFRLDTDAGPDDGGLFRAGPSRAAVLAIFGLILLAAVWALSFLIVY